MSQQNHSTLLGGVRGSCHSYRLLALTRAVASPSTASFKSSTDMSNKLAAKNKTILCPMYQECPWKCLWGSATKLSYCSKSGCNFFTQPFYLFFLFIFFTPILLCVCQAIKASPNNGGTCLTMVLLQSCGKTQQRSTKKCEADSRDSVTLWGFPLGNSKCKFIQRHRWGTTELSLWRLRRACRGLLGCSDLNVPETWNMLIFLFFYFFFPRPSSLVF